MDYQYKSSVKFNMKIPSRNDFQRSLVWKMGVILVKIQEKDSNFAFIKARDDEVLAYSRQKISK